MRPCVQTQYGVVRGTVTNGTAQFHAIPYAKPPVGPRRFRPPERPEPWPGVLDGARPGYIAPQYPSDLDKPMGPVTLPMDEDCLTLSVSTPSLEGRLPVAVWLHGGANCYGGGDLLWYDGACLARREGIVEVNVNFRLGVFGFLCAEGIQDSALSIEDQLLALRWVQENISRFGGDPGRVTLFGQSAGGNAIAHILSREDSEGLFQQIVLQSPSLGRGNHRREDAWQVGRAVLDNLGISPECPDKLARLQRCSTEELLSAAGRIPKELERRHQGMCFKPVMDSWHTPEQTVRRASEMVVRRNIRIMLGFSREELRAFLPSRGPLQPEALSQQRLRYELPGRAFAQAAADGGCEVWRYEFDWSAPNSIYGACHCLELPFLFGNLAAWDAPFLAGSDRAELERLRDTLQSAWGRFFRGEMPDDWPPYTSAEKAMKIFDNRANPLGVEPPYERNIPADGI